jgi:amidophosphoribosyltransferase
MTPYPKHYCGVFGAIGVPNAAGCSYYGLFALQHRGQESSGIVSTEKGKFFVHKGEGLVSHVFAGDALSPLKGSMAVGHNRYSTTGGTGLNNAQPLTMICKFGDIALAHNGNLTNTDQLRKEVTEAGAALKTTTDSEIMLHLLAQSRGSLEEAIVAMMGKAQGAYSLVIMTPNELIAVRDPHGFRPLSIGRLGNGWVVASETCAFGPIRAEFERDVEPGEIVIFDKDGMREIDSKTAKGVETSFCAFEKIYFARRSSLFGGERVNEIRKRMGRMLFREYPIHADVVVPIPSGGLCAARGYSQESGIEYNDAFERNSYAGRSFLYPNQSARDMAVDVKLTIIPEEVSGKRVILVDDSIVRGTTTKGRIAKVRDAGAREVHMLVSCPPHMHPCVYGIDFPDKLKLLAYGKSLDEVRQILNLDSLGYLSMKGLREALGVRGHCLACFNGKYPIPLTKVTA